VAAAARRSTKVDGGGTYKLAANGSRHMYIDSLPKVSIDPSCGSAAFARNVSFGASWTQIQAFPFFTIFKCYQTYQLLYNLYLLFNA